MRRERNVKEPHRPNRDHISQESCLPTGSVTLDHINATLPILEELCRTLDRRCAMIEQAERRIDDRMAKLQRMFIEAEQTCRSAGH